MATRQKGAPSTVKSVDQRATAIALRRDGYVYSRIGEIMGITKQGANKLVLRALEARREELTEGVEEIRTLENERLDKLTRILFKRLDDPRNPDVEKTVTAILRTMRRRADMNGLDAPKDFRITPGGSNVVPTSGDIDVTTLSVDELRELEQIQSAYDALKARQALRLPAGPPVVDVPAPSEEEEDHVVPTPTD